MQLNSVLNSHYIWDILSKQLQKKEKRCNPFHYLSLMLKSVLKTKAELTLSENHSRLDSEYWVNMP